MHVRHSDRPAAVRGDRTAVRAGWVHVFRYRDARLSAALLIQALRLAKAAGDRALGAHILADMSMQAHHLGHHVEALAFADAGVRTATDCGSPSTAARCHALRARAHALAGDEAGSDAAMGAAERSLERAHTNEPSWIRFFTADQLAAEHMYVAADLHRPAHVRRHAVALPAPHQACSAAGS